jgi:hypothetical protein
MGGNLNQRTPGLRSQAMGKRNQKMQPPPGLPSIKDFHWRLNRNVHIEFFEAQPSET